MATAEKSTKIIPEKVIPAVVEETVTLTLTKEEATILNALTRSISGHSHIRGVIGEIGSVIHAALYGEAYAAPNTGLHSLIHAEKNGGYSHVSIFLEKDTEVHDYSRS